MRKSANDAILLGPRLDRVVFAKGGRPRRPSRQASEAWQAGKASLNSMDRDMTIRACAFLVAWACAGTVSAQTIDDFLIRRVLQRVNLLVNSRDWEALKATFEREHLLPG